MYVFVCVRVSTPAHAQRSEDSSVELAVSFLDVNFRGSGHRSLGLHTKHLGSLSQPHRLGFCRMLLFPSCHLGI